MGLCIGKSEIDNDAELLFQLAIQTYSLTSHSFEGVLHLFHSIRSVEESEQDNIIEENQTYSSKDYQAFTQKFYNKESNLRHFHKEFPPGFDRLFEYPLKEDPEYNFFTFAFGFLSGSSKAESIHNFLLNSDKETSVKDFEQFLKHYLDESLGGVTKRMNAVLQTTDDGVFINNSYCVDSELKRLGNEVQTFFESKEFYLDIIKEVTSFMFGQVKDINQLKVEDFERVEKRFPFLFSIVELRCYVWDKYADYMKRIRIENLRKTGL